MHVVFDGHCFGCGQLNPDGLRMVFTPSEGGSVCEFSVPERFQSWAGMAHGGIVSLMLDEAVGWAAWHAGHPGVTGRLTVALRRPLKLGERVRVVGRVESTRRTLVYCTAVVESLESADRIADAMATLVMTDTKVEVAGQ